MANIEMPLGQVAGAIMLRFKAMSMVMHLEFAHVVQPVKAVEKAPIISGQELDEPVSAGNAILIWR